MLINLLLMSIGAFIGMMVSSMCAVAKQEDEKSASYFRGYERGLREGKLEERTKCRKH